MNLARLPLWRQRALVLGSLFLAGLLIWLVLIGPVLDVLGRPRDSIKTSTRLLTSYRAAAAARPGLEKTLQDLKAQASSMPGLAQGDTPAVAAAQLQGDTKSIVENLGGTIHSSQNLPPAISGNYEEIALSYSAAVPLDKLSGLLYGLETHTPYLLVSDLHIQVPENGAPNNSSPINAELQWTERASHWTRDK